MEDDRKLCESSLPEGATVSALFEPDVDINIEVSTRHQTQKLTVSNATSVLALKAQICGVMRCGVEPEKLEIRLGDITLEDSMPLHFYGVKEGSKLEAMKPHVNVTLENTKGTEIYWRLNRKDTIRDIKIKLPTMSNRPGEYPDSTAKEEQVRLFLVKDGQNFYELDDDKTVDGCKIKEDDTLYLLSYKWTKKVKVTVMKTGRDVRGCERDDTCFVIKVKAQDQTGMPVNTIKLARLVEYEWVERTPRQFRYVHKYKQLKEIIDDEEVPFNYKEPLSIVTEEELKADATSLKQEEKEWREKVRAEENRPDRKNRLEERIQLGYQLEVDFY